MWTGERLTKRQTFRQYRQTYPNSTFIDATALRNLSREHEKKMALQVFQSYPAKDP